MNRWSTRLVPVSVLVLAALVVSSCGNREPVADDPLAVLLGVDLDGLRAGPEAAAAPGAGDDGVLAPGSAPAEPSIGVSGAPAVSPGGASGVAPGASSSAAPRITVPTGAQPSRSASPAQDPSSAGAAADRDSAPVSGPAGAAGPKAYDQGVSDTEIKFAAVTSTSGLANDLWNPQGARAYFKYLNSKGGVNGRKLSVVLYDDQFDVTRQAAYVRQANESDKVFAFVFTGGPLSAHGGQAYIEQHKIAVVGGDTSDPVTWGKSPFYYPQSYLESGSGGRLAGRFMGELGCKKPVGLTLNAEAARAWTTSAKQGLNDVGIADYAYFAELGLAETDYTPYVARAKSSGGDCITFAGFYSNFNRLHKAMSQQNYDAKIVFPSSAYDSNFVEGSKGSNDGDYAVVQYDLLENTANPAIREFVEMAKRFEPNMRQHGYTLQAWVSGKIAAEALQRMGDNLTRANLVTTLDSMTDYQTGIVPPVTFRPGPKPGSPCGNVIQLQGTAWSMVKKNFCL